ncbi:hypothetical protein [Galbibacter pacificus]|uniref:PKD domain-containing protein n=1 Tax=Galbibacter pacificus TaxID=2996052 RepID=A0ABT6FUC7_9FLAO|nr:hypothetical protein [Galbibacter pacificus]MDG3583235.1 hypothetical protein [Galbibacter pacificus]MDG3586716.1 hypothetical protein [Galbibacter pacificus]
MSFKYNHIKKFGTMAIAIGLFFGCQPDEIDEGNGLTDPNVDASFTISPIEGKTNRYLLEAQTQNVISSQWDFGDGVFKGKMTEEVFYPDAGTYNITHIAVGRGGAKGSLTKELVVETSDPVAGNLVQGGKFANEDDYAKWTILKINPSGSEWVFNEGSATLYSTESSSQQGIYQTIEVKKDKVYTIDMKVSGGANQDTWFEIYAGTTVPQEGSDYTDTRIMGLNTWDGCGNEAFSGKLSQIGCVKNSQTETVSNEVTFEQDGTIYLVIRGGGASVAPEGITITDVEMRGS